MCDGESAGMPSWFKLIGIFGLARRTGVQRQYRAGLIDVKLFRMNCLSFQNFGGSGKNRILRGRG